MQLYFPEIAHPAFGVVRAIVKDSSDADLGAVSQTFLDSDGQVRLQHALYDPGHMLQACWHALKGHAQPFMSCRIR